MPLSTTESDVLNDNIIIELRQRKSKDSLDLIFSEHSINNIQQKSQYLKRTMNETALYYAGSPSDISLEDLYQDTETIFLHGAWRAFS